MNNVLFGTNDQSALRDAKEQLVNLLGREGFQLSKWATNHSTLDFGNTLPMKEFQSSQDVIDDLIRILGLL